MSNEANEAIKALKVTCPFCLSGEGTVTLDLNDLGKITCTDCEVEFSAREAVETLESLAAGWRRVAAWIDSAPVVS